MSYKFMVDFSYK